MSELSLDQIEEDKYERAGLEILEAIAHDLRVIEQARGRIEGNFDKVYERMKNEKRVGDR